MAHEWDRGVLDSSSWHGLEDIGQMLTALDLITHAENAGAWPVSLRQAPLFAKVDAYAPIAVEHVHALVGSYRQHGDRVLGINGGRHRATTPEEWRSLCIAADEAGAKPTGGFSLRDGRRVLATFEVGARAGLVSHLVLADSFDGSLRLTAGTSSIRVVCANTLSAAMSADGKGMAQLRHTASLEHKIHAMREAITVAVRTGDKVATAFERASDTVLQRDRAKAAFDALFPEAAEDATITAKSRAENTRHEARQAAAMAINKVGNASGNLATLWNAATYLVDRRADGSYRQTRGDADALDSLLFGARAKRLAEIEHVIQVIMADGSVQDMTVPQATEAGVPTAQIGSGLLASMLDDYVPPAE